MVDTITMLGMLAAITSSIRVIPQVIKGFKTKKVRDVSIWWERFGEISAILWLAYGILIKNLPIILGASLATISFALLLYQKRMYGKN
tara:strand:+ start:172 stop:435 length:264 start_codon:yes stop_codon:yes gene_type:complete